ncbi:MAG: phosphatase PAP2 family protein [Crocinitomicaceae bacterium]|nr:phosphatase PAP2 family protein [Crocinitomicaceae bacterium]
MKLIRTLLPFLTIAGLFLLTGLILVLITEKEKLHLSVNGVTGGPYDQFFAWYTYIGDGLVVPVIVLLVSLAYPKKFVPHLVLGLTTFAISGLLAQFFKRVVFSDYFRPSVVLEGKLHLIDGVNMHGGFSFPSGHSTVSFGLFIFIAYVFRKYRSIQGFCAILAILAAYSRVHISQHFIEDIIAGAFLGILTFFLMHWILGKFIFKEKLVVQ